MYLVAFACSDVRHGIALSNAPSHNGHSNNYLAIQPLYRQNIVWTNGGVLARHARFVIYEHHDNQGYRFELWGCPAVLEGQ